MLYPPQFEYLAFLFKKSQNTCSLSISGSYYFCNFLNHLYRFLKPKKKKKKEKKILIKFVSKKAFKE